MNKFWLELLSIIFFCPTVIEEEATWQNLLTNYIKFDARLHQILILLNIDPQIENYRIESIIQGISNQYPVWKIDFHEATFSNAEKLALKPQFHRPRSSLIILFYSFKDDCSVLGLTGPINFITRLSQNRSRPKCLIIILQKTHSCSYKVLLMRMWSRQFLDATVLEIMKVPIRIKNGSLSRLVRLLDHQSEIAVMHYYNPFNKSYINRGYSKGNQLFPGKTYNLYNYKMKVGFLDHPPDAVLQRDSSGKIQKVSGLGKLAITALSTKMNFKMIIPSKPSTWGSSCDDVGRNMGMFQSLEKNQIQIIAVELGRFLPCEEKLYEWSRGLYPLRVSVVVPSRQTTSTFFISNWKFLNGIVVISLPLLVLLVSRALNFERQNWNLAYMFQILFATTVPREPHRLSERIIFGSMLVMCLLNSSYIYTAFTDNGLRINSTYQFQTVEEIISSDLRVATSRNIYKILYSNDDRNLRRLLKNVIMRHTSDFIGNLTQFKNSASIMRKDLARALVAEKRDNCGRTLMRILDKSLITAESGTALSPGSPYVERVDVLLQRLIQSGISRKWELTSFRDKDSQMEITSDSCTPRRMVESVNLAKQLIFILTFAYGSAILIFFGELLIACIMK